MYQQEMVKYITVQPDNGILSGNRDNAVDVYLLTWKHARSALLRGKWEVIKWCTLYDLIFVRKNVYKYMHAPTQRNSQKDHR